MSLEIRPKAECEFDQISLGEVMLRLDPGEGRIRSARHFQAWAGGGEYNTSSGLRKVFGYRTAVITSLVDNEIGHLIEDFIMQSGVSTEFIHWREDDGIGRAVRNGLNFTERGFGIRGAKGVSDRGHTAASQMKPDDIDWDDLFGRRGVRWFHTGGIFAALSDSTAALTLQAVKAAKKHGTIVSYDLNYRPSIWRCNGGLARAQEVNLEIAKHVDVMVDFTACLGFKCSNNGPGIGELTQEEYKRMMQDGLRDFPHLKVAANTRRKILTASRNDWSALLWHEGQFYGSRFYPEMEVLDPVGGGDSFASGLMFGFLEFNDPQKAVDYGAAHGAHASTTPGDISMAIREELGKLIAGGSARVER